MPTPTPPTRIRSDIAADMAEDIAELRRLKQLQARIFDQLRSDEQQREVEQQRHDCESLLGLTRLLVELTKKLRDERDALAAELEGQNRIVALQRMADEIMALGRRGEPSADVAPPQPSTPPSLGQPARRALNAGSRPAQRTSASYSARNERATWAFRS